MIYPETVERCHEVIRGLHQQYVEQASRAAAAEMQRDAAVADIRRLEAENFELKVEASPLEPVETQIPTDDQIDDTIDDVFNAFGEGGAA